MGKGKGKGQGKGEANIVAMAGWGHSNTVVTETTYGDKMGNAMCGVCMGPILYIIALIMVGWNEYHTVQVGKAIDAAEADSQDANCDSLSSDLVDKLVFLSCPVTGTGQVAIRAPFAPPPPPGPAPPTDPNVWAGPATALRIEPKVEYFAWKEHCSSTTVTCTAAGQPSQHCSGAGSDITETTCTNQPEWTAHPQTNFQNQAPNYQQQWDINENQRMVTPCQTINYRGVSSSLWPTWSPPPPPPGGQHAIGVWSFWQSAPKFSCSLTARPELQPAYADQAKVGTAYPLNHAAIDEIAKASSASTLNPAATSHTYGGWGASAIDGKFLCLDSDSCSTSYSHFATNWWSATWGQKIGNRRVSFKQVSTAKVSALAKQGPGGALVPWEHDGIQIFKMMPGDKTKADLIQLLHDDATSSRWAFRICGWLLAWLGLQMFVGPLTVAPDIVPLCGPAIGDMVDAVLCCVTGAVATSTVVTVAAIVWIFVRPMIGIPLLFFGLGTMAGAIYTSSQRGSSNPNQGFISAETLDP